MQIEITTESSVHMRTRLFHLQLGLDVEGLATSKPDAAPGALDPVDPRLLSTPCSATGLSEAMKLESEPVARSSCRRWSSGVAKES